jgi:adenine/guanine phosphoribosyltransferase-like PRPP-binding protein
MPDSNRLWRVLADCDAIYLVRKDEEGNRLSPLVGYAGKHEGPNGTKLQYVGETYYDFARVEQDTYALATFAATITERVGEWGIDLVLGMPMGGIALSFAAADKLSCSFAFAEKKVTTVATADAREQSELVIDRHKIPEGSLVAIGEDVCNNFSTSGKAIELVESFGAKVIMIVCAINRSQDESGHAIKRFADIPVISALEIPTQQYRQDDSYVAADIARDNVVWKPKNKWDDLMAAMKGEQV